MAILQFIESGTEFVAFQYHGFSSVNYISRRLSSGPPLAVFPCGYHVFNVPYPISDASGHAGEGYGAV